MEKKQIGNYNPHFAIVHAHFFEIWAHCKRTSVRAIAQLLRS